jgi:ribosome maturation factor RimP
MSLISHSTSAQQTVLDIETRVAALAEPLCESEGLEVLDVEFSKEGGSWVLRLFLDSPNGGVGIDQCTAIGRVLGPALDVEDFITQEYSLEVSTPGLNRPLKKPAHFARAVGKKVKVRTEAAHGEPARRNFLGELLAADETTVTIRVKDVGDFVLPMSDIDKANIEHTFEEKVKPGKGPSKKGQLPKKEKRDPSST